MHFASLDFDFGANLFCELSPRTHEGTRVEGGNGILDHTSSDPLQVFPGLFLFSIKENRFGLDFHVYVKLKVRMITI